MAVKKEVVAIIGKYKDKDGNEKNRYLTIGRVIDGKNGDMIKIDSIPVGWDGWAYLNDPRDNSQDSGGQAKPQAQKAPAQQTQDFEDDIPF